MTSKTDTNSNSNIRNSKTITLGGDPSHLPKTPTVNSNRPKSARQSTRINSGRSDNQDQSIKPVKHEPCSSTLAKFHDSVNNSLMYDNIASSRKNIPHPPIHPIQEAKNKYRYMLKQKSYVDESLFGGSGGNLATPRSITPSFTNNYDYQNVNQNHNNHLTHNLMSNMTPLIINPRPRSASASGPVTARPRTARQEDSDKINSEMNSSKLTYQKPWKP
jgi:hypothetical protein